MKSVLISIQPKWCEQIANGSKTIEVRKTKPKLDKPFKVYIYCTRNKKQWLRKASNFVRKIFITENIDVLGRTDKVKSLIGDWTTFVENGGYNGKVIGEFICDAIIEWHEDARPPVPLIKTCLSYSQIRRYWGHKEKIFLWHISNPKLYDKPRELSEFKHECHRVCLDTKARIECDRLWKEGFNCDNLISLTRPPQSWCYVESEVDTE